jgi:hypothetical protein
MTKDIVRTKHLKESTHLHEDIKRVVEFYCFAQNVMYCQGMLEVLLPFLYMKQVDEHADFDLACVYAFFKRFVRHYIPNNLHTKFNGRSQILPYLKCCLHLTDLLLGY